MQKPEVSLFKKGVTLFRQVGRVFLECRIYPKQKSFDLTKEPILCIALQIQSASHFSFHSQFFVHTYLFVLGDPPLFETRQLMHQAFSTAPLQPQVGQDLYTNAIIIVTSCIHPIRSSLLRKLILNSQTHHGNNHVLELTQRRQRQWTIKTNQPTNNNTEKNSNSASSFLTTWTG